MEKLKAANKVIKKCGIVWDYFSAGEKTELINIEQLPKSIKCILGASLNPEKLIEDKIGEIVKARYVLHGLAKCNKLQKAPQFLLTEAQLCTITVIKLVDQS